MSLCDNKTEHMKKLMQIGN